VRLVGTGKYAADVDLHSKAMTDYMDELARRHVAIDPTLVTFENSYVPDAGTLPPAVEPYAETLPAQFERGFLSTSTPPTPEVSRDRMRASFAKLVALVGELALVDGDPSKNIGDLRQVELVMRDGRVMDAGALRAAIGISGLPRR
jgi:hypothetical protein